MSSNLYLMFYNSINLDLNLMKKGQRRNLLMCIINLEYYRIDDWRRVLCKREKI